MTLEYNSSEAIQYLKGLMISDDFISFCGPLERYVIKEMKDIHAQIENLKNSYDMDGSNRILKMESLYGKLDSFAKVLIFCENERRKK